MLRFSLTLIAALAALLPALAQTDLGDIVTDLKAKTPKCVVLIMDVSESMKVDDYNRKMHDAAGTILKDSLSDGDQVVLYTFGAGYKKIFDETPSTPAARRKLMDQLPLKPEPGEGAVFVVLQCGFEVASGLHPDVGCVVGEALVAERLAFRRGCADAVVVRAEVRHHLGRGEAGDRHRVAGANGGEREGKECGHGRCTRVGTITIADDDDGESPFPWPMAITAAVWTLHGLLLLFLQNILDN